jgi:hypothetical protein
VEKVIFLLLRMMRFEARGKWKRRGLKSSSAWGERGSSGSFTAFRMTAGSCNGNIENNGNDMVGKEGE